MVDNRRNGYFGSEVLPPVLAAERECVAQLAQGHGGTERMKRIEEELGAVLLNRGAGANLHRGAAVFVVKFAPNQGAGFVKYQQF